MEALLRDFVAPLRDYHTTEHQVEKAPACTYELSCLAGTMRANINAWDGLSENDNQCHGAMAEEMFFKKNNKQK